MKSSDVPSSLQKRTKYAVRFYKDLKVQGLQRLVKEDSTVVVDPG